MLTIFHQPKHNKILSRLMHQEIIPKPDTNSSVNRSTQDEITSESTVRATNNNNEGIQVQEPVTMSTTTNDSNTTPIANNSSSDNIATDKVTDIAQELRDFLPKNIQEGIEKDTTARLEALRRGKTVDGDSTSMDNYKSTSDSLLPTPGLLTTQAKLTDLAMKSMVASIDTIAESLGKQITKSNELTKAWKAHIANLDTFISKLSSWKRLLGSAACLITIGLFIWKMGGMRAIPDFLTNMIGVVPGIVQEATSKTTKETSKEGLNLTIDTIMETPLTPITIVTGVGLLTIGIGMLKIIAWAIRKAPK
jgi:hypothetical protein